MGWKEGVGRQQFTSETCHILTEENEKEWGSVLCLF